jgi:DNA polymerase-1
MRPIEFLPIKFPKDHDPGPAFFYENIAKPLLPDMIGIMNAGLHIDQEAVEELRTTIDVVLAEVATTLGNSPLISQYQELRRPALQKAHEEEATKAVRDAAYYLKEYKPVDMVHRTWVVNTFLRQNRRSADTKEKWTIKAVKQYNVFLKNPFLTAVVEKRPLSQNKVVLKAMQLLAEYKAELWNRPRYEKAARPVEVEPFNPGSDKQTREFFEMVGIEPREFSAKTGAASWPRKLIEQIKKETEDPDLLVVLGAMIDHSFGQIIKSNFLKAFDTFTVDGVLHGNIKLFGAKSFRPTSNSPNLLNAPSTGSIYAKPLKRCFVAPDGFIVYTADLSAVEDRVIANLSGDENKCNIFLEGLDGHSLNACGYFKDELEEIVGLKYEDDQVAFVKAFMELNDAEDKTIGKYRQDSKAPTFKLAYGGYPDDHKGGVITQDIFDNYHNVLYPGITDYRENYVLETARNQGYIHLGLGCRLYTSNADDQIRTLHNATVQFWSILTLIAINEFNHRIREAGMENDVIVNSTIYDSIYTYTRADAKSIKWVNDNLPELMCVPYLEDQIIPNEAQGEIGLNWAELHKVKNNATEQEIQEVLDSLFEEKS